MIATHLPFQRMLLGVVASCLLFGLAPGRPVSAQSLSPTDPGWPAGPFGGAAPFIGDGSPTDRALFPAPARPDLFQERQISYVNASAATVNEAALEAEYYSFDELQAEMKKLAWTKGSVRIVPYGSLWADMTYSTQPVYPGAYTMWVESAQTHHEPAFVIDARRTRLGVDLSGPTVPIGCGFKSGGKVEIDFFGSSVTENTAGILLRHAYWEAKNEYWRFLVGQTWDLFSPLYARTLSYSVGWQGGNIGYRRVQFRAERYLNFSDDFQVAIQGALAQDIANDFTVPAIAGVIREPSDWPIVEGRIGTTLGPRGKGCRPVELGVSGHIGETGFHLPAVFPGPGDDLRFRTWSLNADASVPITDKLSVQGELFIGANLSPFLGGIGQGVSRYLQVPIRDRGGWFDVQYEWTKKVRTRFGWGVDNPLDQDILVGRTFNEFIYGNIEVAITERLTSGIELTYWKTLYADDRLVVPPGTVKITEPGETFNTNWMVKWSF